MEKGYMICDYTDSRASRTMNPELYCREHGKDKEPMGGRSAHISNWYCPECLAESQRLAKLAIEAQKMTESSK